MNINEIVQKHGFRFSKKFGQNFIGDDNLLDAIVSDAGITENDCVLEIGAGAGTLTRRIAQKAKKVITFEIDGSLKPVLEDTLGGLNNVEVVFADVMRFDAEQIDKKIGGEFKVVANLPYYITTPVLFRLLECKNMVSATVMVQKEVAERICARENTPEYGSLSVAVQLVSAPEIKRIVKRTCFVPPPGVDSAIVRMDVAERYEITDKNVLEKLVRSAFAMRRKTLVNNLIGGTGTSRVQAEELLKKVGLPVMTRGEAVSVEQFVRLGNTMCRDRNDENV